MMDAHALHSGASAAALHTPAPGRPKLRVLCLHGFGESEESMAARIEPLAAALRHLGCEFVVPPHSGPWWRASSLLWPEYRGADDAVTYVERFLRERGPFDGVLGFSQGACLAGLLCALQQRRQRDASLDFRFAIMCCGFASRDSQHAHLYEGPIHVPSLHIIGSRDWFFLRIMASNLASCFCGAVVSYHDGGHDLPEDTTELEAFIRAQLPLG
eukprot:TRINITY_DN28688_c0_g1_i1.p1 TRINITY_DN28688_c0_g1~~TRINITY_DN28688_c0_g1_i1.p1  ORF type:complete len:214 (+),score=34.89 TRINITY_DN28688_c0_g1_i1:90-731(+)